jgi:transcription initiation factor IIF auxiliary subunit
MVELIRTGVGVKSIQRDAKGGETVLGKNRRQAEVGERPYNTLLELINSEEYQNMTDDPPGTEDGMTSDEKKAELLEKKVRDRNRKAKKKTKTQKKKERKASRPELQSQPGGGSQGLAPQPSDDIIGSLL